jgi:hypothetical protein
VDDEVTSFTQRGTFRVIRDRHTQKGPYFPKEVDYTVDVPSGTVTSRVIEKDGKEKTETEHMDLPTDLCNGMMGIVLLNVSPNAPEFKVGMVAPTGKGRLIRLAVSPAGQGTFSVVGTRRKASIFRIKPELGGLAGAIAPVVGKQPKDVMVWVIQGESPGIIRELVQLYEGAPMVSVEISGTSFPESGTNTGKP